MYRLNETTELRLEKICHSVVQFVYGTGSLWREGQCWINGRVGDQQHLKKTSIV